MQKNLTHGALARKVARAKADLDVAGAKATALATSNDPKTVRVPVGYDPATKRWWSTPPRRGNGMGPGGHPSPAELAHVREVNAAGRRLQAAARRYEKVTRAPAVRLPSPAPVRRQQGRTPRRAPRRAVPRVAAVRAASGAGDGPEPGPRPTAVLVDQRSAAHFLGWSSRRFLNFLGRKSVPHVIDRRLHIARLDDVLEALGLPPRQQVQAPTEPQWNEREFLRVIEGGRGGKAGGAR
jgi:hypothetical protein